jgi:Fe-S cluster assembly ATP-binding protein
MLSVQNLKVSIGEVQILKGIDMEVPSGELHAIMGPNGSGKSTFCHAVMGNPDYEQSGSIQIGDTDVSKLPPNMKDQVQVFSNHFNIQLVFQV